MGLVVAKLRFFTAKKEQSYYFFNNYPHTSTKDCVQPTQTLKPTVNFNSLPNLGGLQSRSLTTFIRQVSPAEAAPVVRQLPVAEPALYQQQIPCLQIVCGISYAPKRYSTLL